MDEKNSKVNPDSCVETPAAPDWLSKLENRREELMRGKLGHEAGAGANCNACGNKCPGLDLHFWRKVCRNCKCRKDQHMCTDENLSGWAQFEILGQIRSKPAFIKIKALENQPVRLEWVPPNVTSDVVSEYMGKLGTAQIPIAGSDAAAKRKQQLEFQVPPHDLDAALCDNLSELEATQLQQYVQKIRDNCVGQGRVVRVGNVNTALEGHIPLINTMDESAMQEYVNVMQKLNQVPVSDPILCKLLTTEKLKNALVSDSVSQTPKMFVVFSEPLSDFLMDGLSNESHKLSIETKAKLFGLNDKAVLSLVQNGAIYDKMLAVLKDKNFHILRDPKLSPIAYFRKEYLQNVQFRNDIDAFCNKEIAAYCSMSELTSPIKTKLAAEFSFNSPIPLKNSMQARFGSQMRQDTPMRKVKLCEVPALVYDLGLPSNINYDNDQVFAQIINSDLLKTALQCSKAETRPENIVLTSSPMLPDIREQPMLSSISKNKLSSLGVNSKSLQSVVLNGLFYDRIFKELNDSGIDISACKLLAPLKHLREELLVNNHLSHEAAEFVSQIPNGLSIAYGCHQHLIKSDMRGSRSNDSGFESKPGTPNYSTHPGFLPNDDINASAEKITPIPAVEDMNMYPNVQLCSVLSHPLQNIHLSDAYDNEKEIYQALPLLLNCRDCQTPIKFGEVAVTAERVGKEIAWHPECFKCHTCRELLADLVYFFNGGHVYCGRDLAIKLKIPRCKACDELIFTKEYTAAEGETFHIKHFCCYQCDIPLAGQQYVPDEKSNMPLCLKCYDDFFAAACQRCQRAIGPADQGVAWGEVHWHGPCFVCAGASCAKSLIGGRFCVKQNMPFCSPACVRSIIK